MKKISIWDMDFYYKKSFQPNPIAMKISSFYKQQNCIINFVMEESHINLSFDEYFIIREKASTPKPSGKLMDDQRSRLIGRTFRFFDNFWKPSPVISAVRPDYMLYPENENDAYYNANIAQFYHEGKRLLKKQPFENTKSFHKKTLVIDKEFWDVSDDDIESCLQELKEYKNIAFLHPINLKKIATNYHLRKLFKELHFSQGTIFKFRNNYGHEFEDMLVLYDFIDELKAAHDHVKFTNLPVKAVTLDHWEGGVDAGLYDLERCLRIADEAKRRKIHIRIVSPENRFDSPFWYYFEILEYWTIYLERLSYIEMMLNSATKKSKLQWFQILNNPKKWVTPNTYFLLSVLTKKPEWIEKYGYRQWGENFIDKFLIQWDSVNTYIGSWEKDMKNTEVEHE